MKSLTDNFGYALKNIRETMGYSQDEVFHGIISRIAWNKYENGELTPDMFMFQVLLERLGVADDRFEFIIPDALHEFYVWYLNCFAYAEKRNWEKLLIERERFDSLTKVNAGMYYQYRDFIDYIINRQVNNNYEKAYFYIKKAIDYTIKDVDQIVKQRKRLSVFEWHLITNLYDIEYELFPDKKERITDKLYEFYKYADRSIEDGLVKHKIVPRLGLSLLRNDRESFDIGERLELEGDILKILTKFFCIRELPEILKLLIEDEPAFGKKNIYMKQKEAIESVFAMAGVSVGFMTEIHITNVKKYMVLSDVFRIRRKEVSLSVEALIADICDVKTYSRAELGKSYPKKTILKNIAKRLNLRWLYFKGEIESAEYEDFMLMSECRRLASLREYKKLYKEKEKLKQRLDMRIPLNKQAVEGLEIYTEEISDEEKIKRLWEIFSYTGEVSENSIYTREEIEFLSNIARFIGIKEPYKGIEMLERFFADVSNKKSAFNIRIAIISKDLAWLYKNIKEYGKSYNIALNEIKAIIIENDTGFLLNLLDYSSTIEEELGNIEEAKKICKDMFYIAELYEMYEDAYMIKDYYEKVFDSNIRWY
nr:helix-turn-helix transcriptional regulator [uncultured Catonella sp.]